MSVPLIWTMIGVHHAGTALTGGGWIPGLHAQTSWMVPLFFVILGWHIVFQLYKKSAKVEGF